MNTYLCINIHWIYYVSVMPSKNSEGSRITYPDSRKMPDTAQCSVLVKDRQQNLVILDFGQSDRDVSECLPSIWSMPSSRLSRHDVTSNTLTRYSMDTCQSRYHVLGRKNYTNGRLNLEIKPSFDSSVKKMSPIHQNNKATRDSQSKMAFCVDPQQFTMSMNEKCVEPILQETDKEIDRSCELYKSANADERLQTQCRLFASPHSRDKAISQTDPEALGSPPHHFKSRSDSFLLDNTIERQTEEEIQAAVRVRDTKGIIDKYTNPDSEMARYRSHVLQRQKYMADVPQVCQTGRRIERDIMKTNHLVISPEKSEIECYKTQNGARTRRNSDDAYDVLDLGSSYKRFKNKELNCHIVYEDSPEDVNMPPVSCFDFENAHKKDRRSYRKVFFSLDEPEVIVVVDSESALEFSQRLENTRNSGGRGLSSSLSSLSSSSSEVTISLQGRPTTATAPYKPILKRRVLHEHVDTNRSNEKSREHKSDNDVGGVSEFAETSVSSCNENDSDLLRLPLLNRSRSMVVDPPKRSYVKRSNSARAVNTYDNVRTMMKSVIKLSPRLAPVKCSKEFATVLQDLN